MNIHVPTNTPLCLSLHQQCAPPYPISLSSPPAAITILQVVSNNPFLYKKKFTTYVHIPKQYIL